MLLCFCAFILLLYLPFLCRPLFIIPIFLLVITAFILLSYCFVVISVNAFFAISPESVYALSALSVIVSCTEQIIEYKQVLTKLFLLLTNIISLSRAAPSQLGAPGNSLLCLRPCLPGESNSSCAENKVHKIAQQGNTKSSSQYKPLIIGSSARKHLNHSSYALNWRGFL